MNTGKKARRSRDPRFDGLFYVAVKSTGIYCRANLPRPAHEKM
ncbi:Ada metal-binding domain-containing protein (plasmid) [Pseudoalteromonas espejiana]